MLSKRLPLRCLHLTVLGGLLNVLRAFGVRLVSVVVVVAIWGVAAGCGDGGSAPVDTPSSSTQSSDAADRSPTTVSVSPTVPERELADSVGAGEGASLPKQALAVGVVAGGAGLADPQAEEFPEVDVSGTVEWLAGSGAAAVGLVTATAELWTDSDPDCVAVASQLDRLGTPEEIRRAVLATPDPVTAEVLLGLHAEVLASLSVCGRNDLLRAEGAWQWAVAHRRLVELGVIE